MKIIRSRHLAVAVLVGLTVPAGAATLKCAADAVKVGTTCVDKYEASVWQIPVTNKALIKRVQSGKATLADLQASGAVQLGCPGAPYNHTDYPVGFPNNGQWTPVVGSNPPSPGVYAASVAGVLPSACITWFQATQACVLAEKHLVTNREWQDAAVGTPDPGAAPGPNDCNTMSTGPVTTGSRANCTSHWGAFDMVGNVWEWAGDWGTRSAVCDLWPAEYGGDITCAGGDGSSDLPGAMARGGYWPIGQNSGVFANEGTSFPSSQVAFFGFRCSR